MKRGVVTSLVDRVLQVCSPRFLDSELDHLRDILFGNGYPISLINSVIAKCIKKLSDSDTVNTNQRENSVYLGLPYVKGVSDHISKNLRKNNIFTYYRPRKTISSQIYQGKDPIPIGENSGVYRIPCSCGLWYIGRTDQRLTDRLTQHSTSINNTLKKRKKKKTENFYSALSEHIFNNPLCVCLPDHTVLFNQASLISHDKGIVQHYREAVEIYKYQHLGLALNRDSGDLRINESYFGFLKREADTLVIPEINVEPLPNHIIKYVINPLGLKGYPQEMQWLKSEIR